ncbi:MAG TPA: hypothetical protein VG756_30525 [Pseudonocardiaceae bacterium]|jgi:hypothetical protein|nr:hypothetical protein [Pseudonocardiaceae bacterium]
MTSLLTPVRAEVTRRIDRWCYGLGALLFASGLFHLGVQLVLGGPWDGPVSWRKPFDFGLAFGLTLATVTWVTGYLTIGERTRARLLGVFALACVLEVGVITTQAWRGQPSHFNVSSPVNSAFAFTAAGGGALIIVVSVVFARAAFRPAPGVSAAMRLAVRAGFVSFLGTLAIGAFMIALGVITTRTVSQTAAYTVDAAFKSGHAALMHGILILPVLAWLGERTGWTPERRVRVVALGCAGYFLAAGVVVVDTFVTIDPVALAGAPAWATGLTAAGLACLLTAGALTLRKLITTAR